MGTRRGAQGERCNVKNEWGATWTTYLVRVMRSWCCCGASGWCSEVDVVEGRLGKEQVDVPEPRQASSGPVLKGVWSEREGIDWLLSCQSYRGKEVTYV